MKEIIRIIDLVKDFPLSRSLMDILLRRRKYVRALDHINLSIYEGETLGLVGESGSGKTTLGRILTGLIRPTSGKVLFYDEDITKLIKKKKLESQIVFQDPDSSLDPLMRIKDIISEPLWHINLLKEDIEKRTIEIAKRVGLSEDLLDRYPFELSGGQKQRAAIARALISRPKFIVLDEPTSSLDVSIQAQILNLIVDLQKEFNLTYLFISHNIDVVNYVSDRMAVIYAGQIVEIGSADSIMNNPLHPYTKLLMSTIPHPDPKKKILVREFGEVPSLINPPSGCRFHTRCSYAKEICKKKKPPLIEIEKNHYVACYLYTSIGD